MTVFVYVNTRKQVGDIEYNKAFGDQDVAALLQFRPSQLVASCTTKQAVALAFAGV